MAQSNRELSAFIDLLAPTIVCESGFSFTNIETHIAPSPGAHEVADAIVNMLAARAELQVTKQHIPDYTGQWSDRDYIRDEQATYNKACNDLLAALRSIL